ncbi:unnamed protein product, partial [Effrenium voratum]
EEVCKAIVLRKETDADLSKSEMREHPEAPGSGIMQFLVLVEDEVTDENTNTISEVFRMNEDFNQPSSASSESTDSSSESNDEARPGL